MKNNETPVAQTAVHPPSKPVTKPMRAPAPIVIHAGRWLRTYNTTVHAAAADIHSNPNMLTGENKEQSSPAGTASIKAERRADLHSTLLASRTTSFHRSG
jgi:hypothetical protein